MGFSVHVEEVCDKNVRFIVHRKNLTAWANGDNLVLAVAAQNNNTIVIVHSVGPLIVEPWVDHPNVTAVRSFFIYVVGSDFVFSGRLGWTSWSRIGKFPC